MWYDDATHLWQASDDAVAEGAAPPHIPKGYKAGGR